MTLLICTTFARGSFYPFVICSPFGRCRALWQAPFQSLTVWMSIEVQPCTVVFLMIKFQQKYTLSKIVYKSKYYHRTSVTVPI